MSKSSNLSEIEEAIEIYSKIIKVSESSSLLYQRSECYFKIKEYMKALDDAYKLVALNPQTPKFHIHCGLILTKLNKEKEAIEEYNNAIKTNLEDVLNGKSAVDKFIL